MDTVRQLDWENRMSSTASSSFLVWLVECLASLSWSEQQLNEQATASAYCQRR